MRRAAALRAAAVAVTVALVPVLSLAARADEPALCAAPPGGVPIIAPLEHSAARINAGRPLTIVAVGSSSTSGIGASAPGFTYPSLLEVDLRQMFPKDEIRVINRGIAGEDAPEELARLGRDVVAARPDLAIWQVGTNAVLRRDDLDADGKRLREGVDLMKRSGIDVVLMDLQYAPRVTERRASPDMEALIADTADAAHVGLFRRFALMRYWQSSHGPDAPAMIGADGLHMTDAGYDCLAGDLAAVLAANWRAEAKLALHAHTATAAVAGLSTPPAAGPGMLRPTVGVRRNDAMPLN